MQNALHKLHFWVYSHPFYVSLTVTTTWKWRGQEGVLTNIM